MVGSELRFDYKSQRNSRIKRNDDNYFVVAKGNSKGKTREAHNKPLQWKYLGSRMASVPEVHTYTYKFIYLLNFIYFFGCVQSLILFMFFQKHETHR